VPTYVSQGHGRPLKLKLFAMILRGLCALKTIGRLMDFSDSVLAAIHSLNLGMSACFVFSDTPATMFGRAGVG
jgi:hypothetical protein